jgi:hypothetical protein
MLDSERQVDLILDDLLQGRKTVEGLIAQKALYEGKSPMLTNLISECAESGAIGEALLTLYMSIGIVLHCMGDALERKEAAAQLQGEVQ